MNLIYKKADTNDIDNLVDLKVKQILFNYSKDGEIIENEDIIYEKFGFKKQNTKYILKN